MAYPGHSEHSEPRKIFNRDTGRKEEVSIPRPIAIDKYNMFMDGVDKSDQLLSYHTILRKTEILENSTVPSDRRCGCEFTHSIQLYCCHAGSKTITENDFQDALVLQIIQKYGQEKQQRITRGRPPASSCRVRHGSKLHSHKQRCQ